ncbi:hypothetical protein [Rossellomorea marisflavi]|uniref:hypothetical protein n=1 Tax=Rossellomorea marisflavi TaxID=189381 RepID=UPI003FA175B6
MKLTKTEQTLLEQAVEMLATKVSTETDEGNVLVLPDTTYKLLSQVLSPTTVVLSETLAQSRLSEKVSVEDAVHRVGEWHGSVTADFAFEETDAEVHFVKDVGHPFVDYVVESFNEINKSNK